jgi:hypothetical protein
MKIPNWRIILGAMALMGAMWLAPGTGASAAPTEDGLQFMYTSGGNLRVVVHGTTTAPTVVIQDLKVNGTIVGDPPDCNTMLGPDTICTATVDANANSLSLTAVVSEAGMSGKTHVHCANISTTNPCIGGKTVRIH